MSQAAIDAQHRADAKRSSAESKVIAKPPVLDANPSSLLAMKPTRPCPRHPLALTRVAQLAPVTVRYGVIVESANSTTVRAKLPRSWTEGDKRCICPVAEIESAQYCGSCITVPRQLTRVSEGALSIVVFNESNESVEVHPGAVIATAKVARESRNLQEGKRFDLLPTSSKVVLTQDRTSPASPATIDNPPKGRGRATVKPTCDAQHAVHLPGRRRFEADSKHDGFAFAAHRLVQEASTAVNLATSHSQMSNVATAEIDAAEHGISRLQAELL